LIIGNSAGRGGAMYGIDAKLKNVGNTRIQQNVATDKGGGL